MAEMGIYIFVLSYVLHDSKTHDLQKRPDVFLHNILGKLVLGTILMYLCALYSNGVLTSSFNTQKYKLYRRKILSIMFTVCFCCCLLERKK